MNNPVLLFARCCATWWALREFPGVFSLADASRHTRYLLQPARLTEWELRRFIRNELRLQRRTDGVLEVEVKSLGLVFYWRGEISGGLAMGVLQETNPANAHCYTTPPIQLEPESLVLDVGACEGLFAMRLIRQRLAARVICFEPSSPTASLLAQAATRNGVADQINLEVCAVGPQSGTVSFSDSAAPEASRVVAAATPGVQQVRQVCLDDYCRDRHLRIKPTDLIKVDAEGADVDVIRGAERIIREGSPQIAVTTYHDPGHAAALIRFLRSVQPQYRLRLKGFALFADSDHPRPLLLQAALPQGIRPSSSGAA